MATAAITTSGLISVEQYLRMSFEHDAEFVEGRIIARPVPTWEHSILQAFLLRVIYAIAHPFGFFVIGEQRVQVRPDRFRVPDVCVVSARPDNSNRPGVVTQPPHLCVEILSPDDTAVEALEKVREYLSFGVQWVWVIDPTTCTGQIHSRNRVTTVEDKIFSTDRFQVNLADVEF